MNDRIWVSTLSTSIRISHLLIENDNNNNNNNNNKNNNNIFFSGSRRRHNEIASTYTRGKINQSAEGSVQKQRDWWCTEVAEVCVNNLCSK